MGKERDTEWERKIEREKGRKAYKIKWPIDQR